MRRTIYETNYDRLNALMPIPFHAPPDSLPALPVGYRLKSDGFMDLSINYLDKRTVKGTECLTVSLIHYYEQNGDLVPDPDMEIAVYPLLGMCEVLSYQDSFGYQQVYLDENRYYPKLKKDLNAFLRTWLINLRKQGFFKSQPEVI